MPAVASGGPLHVTTFLAPSTSHLRRSAPMPTSECSSHKDAAAASDPSRLDTVGSSLLAGMIDRAECGSSLGHAHARPDKTHSRPPGRALICSVRVRARRVLDGTRSEVPGHSPFSGIAVAPATEAADRAPDARVIAVPHAGPLPGRLRATFIEELKRAGAPASGSPSGHRPHRGCRYAPTGPSEP
jgi:hypothetical protein